MTIYSIYAIRITCFVDRRLKKHSDRYIIIIIKAGLTPWGPVSRHFREALHVFPFVPHFLRHHDLALMKYDSMGVAGT